jgi:tetratricopeptide (TPR) repeat protein
MSIAWRSLVFVIAIVGMGLSAVAATADVLQHAGDEYITRALRTNGETKQALMNRAQILYQKAGQIQPWQPAHAFKLGLAYEHIAVALSPSSDHAHVMWLAAAEAYRRAVYLHPANGRLQAVLAWAALQSGDLIGSNCAVHAALKLAPDFPDVRFIVAQWYMTQWKALSAEDQQLAMALVQRGAHELPELYVEATWQLLRNPKKLRSILPSDLNARRLLLKKLTEQELFAERWAELADYPELRVSAPAKGFRVLASGVLNGRQEPPREAVPAGPWRGMVAGWLSGGLTAKAELDLPPGEVVLYLPMLGESVGGIWPALQVILDNQSLSLPPITGPGWRTIYVLLSTPGGRLPLHATLTNGAVIKENGRFVERRAALSPVRVLIPMDIHQVNP